MDMLRLKEHALLAALLVIACALASSSTAQPTPHGESYDYMAGAGSQQPPQQDVQVSTTMIALLAGAVAVFVFIALSIIYLRHCTTGHYSASYAADRSALPAADVSTFLSRRWQLRQQRGTSTASTRGLAKEVVEAFPTMRYAEAKALRVGKERQEALECAVCLSEFEDEERLRLLPRCSHAFHPDCIGAWLASHVTCPVCRCNLDPDKDPGSDDEPSSILPPPTAPAVVAAEANHSHSASSEIAAVVVRQQNDDVVIDVVAELEEEEAEQRRKEALELQRIGTQQRHAMRSRSSKKARLVRSHSTGHDSLAAAARLGRRDDMERFTLRLPEHVRREMMAASSWDQLSTRRGQKTGGGRRGLSGSGRWPSFFACTRTWSGRLPVFLLPTRRAAEQSSDGGEGSSTSSSRIRGKRVAAVDGGAFAVGAVDRIAAAGGGKGGSVAVDVDDKATSRQVRT